MTDHDHIAQRARSAGVRIWFSRTLRQHQRGDRARFVDAAKRLAESLAAYLEAKETHEGTTGRVAGTT